jgi:acyl dehydratase
MTDHADPLTAMAGAWTRMTGSVLRSAMAANTVTLSAMERATTGDWRRSGTESVAYDDPDWVSTRSVGDPEAIAVGDRVEFAKTLSDADVRAFADASGDTNRLHLDEGFAADTRFGGRIAHGTLVSGLISAALARLPGLTVYVSQDLEFQRPVPIDSQVRATVEVVEDLGGGRFRLSTVVENDDEEAVVDGEAVVFIDDQPE